MKTLALAFGVVLAAILILFFAFRAFGVADKVAGPLAGSLLGLITWVHGVVDKALNGSESKFSKRIIPVSEFGIRWPFLLVYASLIVVAIIEILDVLALLPTLFIIHTFRVNPLDTSSSLQLQYFALMTLIAVPVISWSFFILGRWIGVMAGSRGYWILPLSILIGRSLELLVLAVKEPGFFGEFAHVFHSATSLAAASLIVMAIIGTGLLGVWRGNQVRLGAYFNYLFKQLSDGTRNTILDITFEEAKGTTLQ